MLFPVFLVATLAAQAAGAQYDVIAEWPTLDWDWTGSSTNRQDAIADGSFAPRLAGLSGIAVKVEGTDETIYVSSPRLRGKVVPSALNTVDLQGNKLVAYPSWADNKIGDCNALQNVMGITYDERTKKLWATDSGTVGVGNVLDVDTTCPPKLVVIDTVQNVIEKRYIIDGSIVPRNRRNFLNDAVLDYVDSTRTSPSYAYLTEPITSKIIVIDLNTEKQWAFENRNSMSGARRGLWALTPRSVTIGGIPLALPPSNVNGIMMSPDFDYVYFSPLTKNNVYQIPTSALRQTSSRVFDDDVRDAGEKPSFSDAMFGGKNSFYFGALGEDAMYSWTPSKTANEAHIKLEDGGVKKLASDSTEMQWPDGISVAGGNLYWISSRAQLTATTGFLQTTNSNIRIFKMNVGDESYLAP